MTICAVQIAAALVDFGLANNRYGIIDANNEANVFAWLGGLAIAGAATVTALHARTRRDGRLVYILTFLVLAAFALENRIRVNEALFHKAVVYLPLSFALFLGLTLIGYRSSLATRYLLWLGIGALVASLMIRKGGLEILERVGYNAGSWPYELGTALKETTELAGWLLILIALLISYGRVTTPETTERERPTPSIVRLDRRVPAEDGQPS
jgi:hypothetical protein